MYKFLISLKKETIQFWQDKTGFTLMFIMPMILVFVMTMIQDSAFKLVENKQISLLVVNHDKGTYGDTLTTYLSNSGMFDIVANKTIQHADIQKQITNKTAIAAVYIPTDFSKKMLEKSKQTSSLLLTDFGVSQQKKEFKIIPSSVEFYNDPVLQENYCTSIMYMIQAQLQNLESKQMIAGIYNEMGITQIPKHVDENVQKNKITIDRKFSSGTTEQSIPSSSQHNVPAWTLFAMFFMVVSLGTNIVKERNSGTFLRLQTMPVHFSLIIISKQTLYMCIAILQVFIIFGIGMYAFPYVNLPELIFPSNILATFVVIAACGFTAVSYAMLIGILSKTEEQTNGFGAISIIIFAALGGIWVPNFIMPEMFQKISTISPLHWCIEAFYVLFLKQGNWSDLLKPLLVLLFFSIACQAIAYYTLYIRKKS
ncbi:MAG TPA: ABC transporter permease [Bacteroidales bacterium]|nr:ABC transporter permease [Bacteroidales bacterium]